MLRSQAAVPSGNVQYFFPNSVSLEGSLGGIKGSDNVSTGGAGGCRIGCGIGCAGGCARGCGIGCAVGAGKPSLHKIEVNRRAGCRIGCTHACADGCAVAGGRPDRLRRSTSYAPYRRVLFIAIRVLCWGNLTLISTVRAESKTVQHFIIISVPRPVKEITSVSLSRNPLLLQAGLEKVRHT